MLPGSGNVTVNVLPVPHVQSFRSRSVTAIPVTPMVGFSVPYRRRGSIQLSMDGHCRHRIQPDEHRFGYHQLPWSSTRTVARIPFWLKCRKPSPGSYHDRKCVVRALCGRIFAEVERVPPYSCQLDTGGQVNDTGRVDGWNVSGLRYGLQRMYDPGKMRRSRKPQPFRPPSPGYRACASNCDGHGEVTIAGGVEPYFVTWCNGDVYDPAGEQSVRSDCQGPHHRWQWLWYITNYQPAATGIHCN